MRLLVTVVAVLAVAASAAPAGVAAPPTQAQFKKLQKQMGQLQKRVVVLERENAVLKQRITRNEDMTRCVFAVSWDRENTIFSALNLVIEYVTGQTGTFPAPPALDDQGACARVGITR